MSDRPDTNQDLRPHDDEDVRSADDTQVAKGALTATGFFFPAVIVLGIALVIILVFVIR